MGDIFDFLSPYFGYGTELLAWVLGIVFVVHGWPKIRRAAAAGVWGGSRAASRLHGAAEVLAGIAVALGYYADWGLAAIAVIMLGAIFFKVAKWKTPFTGMNAVGWEFDLVLLAAALALLLG